MAEKKKKKRKFECLNCAAKWTDDTVFLFRDEAGEEHATCPTCVRLTRAGFDALSIPQKFGRARRLPCIAMDANLSEVEILRTIRRIYLRHSVRSFDDAQQLRIAMSNRVHTDKKSKILSGIYGNVLSGATDESSETEARCLLEVRTLLFGNRTKKIPAHEMAAWILAQPGLGPSIGGHLVAEIGDPRWYPTLSALLSYCGLGVDVHRCKCVVCNKEWGPAETIQKKGNYSNGVAYLCPDCKKEEAYCVATYSTAKRRQPGQSAPWNHRLKTKLLGVAVDSLKKTNIRACEACKAKVHDDKSDKDVGAADPFCPDCTWKGYAIVYRDAKRKYLQQACQLTKEQHFKQADGETKASFEKRVAAGAFLPNGCLPGHVDRKAARKMIQSLLKDFYFSWCNVLGWIPRPTYAEEKLGHKSSYRGGMTDVPA